MASASEKLAEHGAACVAISDAVKTAKLLSKKNTEVNKIIEEATIQANALDKVQISDDEALKDFKQPLNELKTVARKVSTSGIEMKQAIVNLIREADVFDKFVMEKVPNTIVPPELVAEFCRLLDNLCQMGGAFSQGFSLFIGHLKSTEEKAKDLADLMNQKKDEVPKRAASTKFTRNTGTAVWGFFTGGAAWVAAAAASAVGTAGLKELTSEIQAHTEKLNGIVKEMKEVGDMVGEFKLDENAKEALENALIFFQRELENEKMAKMKLELAQKEAELARERAERDAEKEELLARIRALENK